MSEQAVLIPATFAVQPVLSSVADRSAIRIEPVTTSVQLAQTRQLIRDFVAWIRIRYADRHDLIDTYFGQGETFERGLDALPSEFGVPSGRLLLAYCDGQPAGCVGLRQLDTERCEMKRMYVAERFQGQGIGRALVAALLDRARDIGYRSMRLDTGPLQTEAQQLYLNMGFQWSEPHYQPPADLANWLVFMKRDL